MDSRFTCALGLIVPVLTLLALARAEAPAGRTFTGRVVDKVSGQPIAGAQVLLHRELVNEHGRWEPVGPPQEVASDADVRFQFSVSAEELANKRFCLGTEVRHPQYAARQWEGLALSLILAEEQRGKQPWFTRLQMLPGTTVSGTVATPEGKPLAGCEIVYESWPDATIRYGDCAIGKVTTDTAGRFSFIAVKDAAETSLRALPADYAVLAATARDGQLWIASGEPQDSDRVERRKLVGGDFGTLRLQPGQRITGTITDAAGAPLAGLHVEAASGLPDRRTRTDAAGRFSLAPLGPGEFQVTVKDDRFVPVRVKVAADQPPAPLAMRPVPLNTVKVRFRDSSGQPSKLRNSVGVAASGGGVWVLPNDQRSGAEVELSVPKDMENVQLALTGHRKYTDVWRIGEVGDWRRGDAIFLGVLQQPVTEVTIVRYKSPTLTVRAAGPDGQPLRGKPYIHYTNQALRLGHDRSWSHDVSGDVGFEPAADGLSWQSTSMLIPGREFSLGMTVDGLWSAGERLKLQEGEQREVTLTLKPK